MDKNRHSPSNVLTHTASCVSDLNREQHGGGYLRGNKVLESEPILPKNLEVDINGTDGLRTGVYPTRWYILLILCGGTMIQNVIWGTWGPIADSAQLVYGWDTTFIFVLTNCSNAGTLFPLIFTAYIVQRKGLRSSMILSTFMLVLGSGLRVITTKTPAASILVAIGQFLGGAAGCVLTSIPSLVSEDWFPLNERTTATTIAVISNALGGTVMFLLGPNLVSQPKHTSSNNTTNITSIVMTTGPSEEYNKIKHEIWILLMIELAFCAILFLSTMIYYPSKPEHPPSISAAEVRLDFKEGIIALLKEPSMWQILLACALPCAVFGNWVALCYVNFKHIGLTQSVAGWFGFSSCTGGVFGGLIIGRIANSFQQRMRPFLLVLFGTTILTIVWTVCLRNEFIHPSLAMVGIAITLLGILINGELALTYEVACETGYPIHEGIIGTLLTLVINAGSVAFLMVQLIPNIGTEWMTWTLLGVFVFGFIMLATLKVKYKRIEIDIQHGRLETGTVEQ